MIDWDLAVATGERLARSGPQVSLAEARQAVAELRTLSVRAESHVREFTRLDGGGPPDQAVVVDRPGWIKANVEGFRVVFEPLASRMAKRQSGGPGGSIVTAVGSRITGVQVGAVLAYMSARVLGQYELFLPPDPDGQAATGRLTLVAPNIVQVERELDVDPHDFRLWVCLHEETHRVQFTAVPWLRAHVQDQITEFLLASDVGLPELLDRFKETADAVADAVRGGESSVIEAIQSPEQKEILDRITAVMTLVEGHGDYVMDGVGPDVVPSVEVIRSRFQKRRQGAGRVDQMIRRVLGLDLKMKQYEQGAAFVRTVVEQAGMDAFNKVWTSPNTLPTRAEIADPQSWITRVVGAAPPAVES
jgi:coenzyme F420 biosynthesis associated uncharacterized protein